MAPPVFTLWDELLIKKIKNVNERDIVPGSTWDQGMDLSVCLSICRRR